MPFQHRSFHKIQNTKGMFDNSSELLDIYIHKKGFVNIGIKIRNPQAKDYGWKMQKFQCKIMMTPIDLSIKNPQLWYKFKIDCEHKLKWNQKSEQQIHEKMKKLNKWLCKHLIEKSNHILQNIMPKYPKGSSELINVQQLFQKWCSEEISQIYFVTKIKTKTSSKQVGKIQVERFLNNRQFFYFETETEEHSSLNFFKILQPLNTSYPQLMDDLLYNGKKIETAPQ